MVKINKNKIKPQDLTTDKPIKIINAKKSEKILGRPKLIETEKSNKKVNCYITEKEYILLGQSAKNKNLPINQYLKTLIKKDLVSTINQNDVWDKEIENDTNLSI